MGWIYGTADVARWLCYGNSDNTRQRIIFGSGLEFLCIKACVLYIMEHRVSHVAQSCYSVTVTSHTTAIAARNASYCGSSFIYLFFQCYRRQAIRMEQGKIRPSVTLYFLDRSLPNMVWLITSATPTQMPILVTFGRVGEISRKWMRYNFSVTFQ